MTQPDRNRDEAGSPDPVLPTADVLAAHGLVVLDPATAWTFRGQIIRPTIYDPSLLLIALGRDGRPDPDADRSYRFIQIALDELGLIVPRGILADPSAPLSSDPPLAPLPGFPVPTSVHRVPVQRGPDVAGPPADAWTVLQKAREVAGREPVFHELPIEKRLPGVSLNHALFATVGALTTFARPALDISPLPFDGPHDYRPIGGAATGYGERMVDVPLAYLPDPAPDADDPVVFVVDTEMDDHRWFGNRVHLRAELPAAEAGAKVKIGIPDQDAAEPDVNTTLSGLFSAVYGHATKIAGVIRQVSPRAQVVSAPIFTPDGIVDEATLIGVLDQLVARPTHEGAGLAKAVPVDVVSISAGGYLESEDHLTDPNGDGTRTIYGVLSDLGELGVSVVVSAGNDCTSRRCYPAALAPHPHGAVPEPAQDVVPLVSVGALNPDDTVAIWSNGGDWVLTYARGAAVVTTAPPGQGALGPAIAFKPLLGRARASLDPDAFNSGFCVVDGTSFAAPYVAGVIANSLVALRAAEGQGDPVTQSWSAVTAALAELGTDLKRP